MYYDIFEKIIKIINSLNEVSANPVIYPKFSGEGYKAFAVSQSNFHEIKSSSDRSIAFVDGGNAEIIGSANFSLNIIRVAYVIYKGKKKAAFNKFEIFAFAKAINKNNEIFYDINFFKSEDSIGIWNMSFSSLDKTLMHGTSRAEISAVANAARRFAELRLAKFVSDAKLADIIVLDGTLQATLTNEKKYLDELYESCAVNDVVLTALSKTSSLFTEDGNLLSAVLSNKSNIPSWFYHPIADITNPNHMADIFFAKFNKNSNHIFRLEIFNMQKSRAESAISGIASSCNDAIFAGYPYGLIEADKLARVSNNEKESLKTMLLVKLKSKELEKYVNSLNAHEILNRISF